jgi:predicted ribosome quality control (RQC) complex YloA/Tae2 family protein
MMRELSSYDVHGLVNEAQILVNGKIDNIYQTDARDLYLQIYLPGKAKQLLRIKAGKYFYLTSARPKFPDNIQRFCAFLRKYVNNGRIKSFEQVDFERIVKLDINVKDTTYEMFVELFGKGNFILVKGGVIVAVGEEQLWADRTLKAGETYTYPKRQGTKELFEKQKKAGSSVSMQVLDEELSKELSATNIPSSKEKEIKKIMTILEKQMDQLRKAESEAEESKRKGELIYERYQELKSLCDDVKHGKMLGSKKIKSFKDNRLVVNVDNI